MTNPEQAENPTQPQRSYLPLWIMITLFLLPYLAAYYFYINRADMDFSETTNYGTLISPVRSVPDTSLTKIDGTTFSLTELRGKWVLFSIGGSDCAADCQDNLYKIRQIKKAIGQEHKQVKKAFFLTDTNSLSSFKTLLGDYPDMSVSLPSGNNYENFLATFSVNGSEIVDGLYIVDPVGNYMMMYPKGADAKKVLGDIVRLLEVSGTAYR
jgi:hypothetical protein